MHTTLALTVDRVDVFVCVGGNPGCQTLFSTNCTLRHFRSGQTISSLVLKCIHPTKVSECHCLTLSNHTFIHRNLDQCSISILMTILVEYVELLSLWDIFILLVYSALNALKCSIATLLGWCFWRTCALVWIN